MNLIAVGENKRAISFPQTMQHYIFCRQADLK
jgi:hypothetical protein